MWVVTNRWGGGLEGTINCVLLHVSSICVRVLLFSVSLRPRKSVPLSLMKGREHDALATLFSQTGSWSLPKHQRVQRKCKVSENLRCRKNDDILRLEQMAWPSIPTSQRGQAILYIADSLFCATDLLGRSEVNLLMFGGDFGAMDKQETVSKNNYFRSTLRARKEERSAWGDDGGRSRHEMQLSLAFAASTHSTKT